MHAFTLKSPPDGPWQQPQGPKKENNEDMTRCRNLLNSSRQWQPAASRSTVLGAPLDTSTEP